MSWHLCLYCNLSVIQGHQPETLSDTLHRRNVGRFLQDVCGGESGILLHSLPQQHAGDIRLKYKCYDEEEIANFIDFLGRSCML